jgi:hypothetical protein
MHRTLTQRGAGFILVFLAGCAGAKTEQPVVTTTADGKTVSPAGTDAAKRGKSMVRFVNAVPDSMGLDLSTDERTTFYNVEFKAVTPYTEINDNLVKFEIRGAYRDSVLANNNETMGDGYRYTVVAMPTADNQIRMRVLRDELVPDSGKARIRVINAAPGLGDADLLLAGQTDPLFDNIAYGTEAGFKDVDPGNAAVEIRGNDSPIPPVRIRSMTLAPGRAYTIVIAAARPRGIQAITFTDAVRGTVAVNTP